MADLRRIKDQSEPLEDIVDAEFVEIDNDAPAPGQTRRQPLDDGAAWREWWRKQTSFQKAGWIGAPLLLLVIFTPQSPPSSDAPASEASVAAIPAEVQTGFASDASPASDVPAEEQLIDACYHFDACGKFRILDKDQVAAQGDERLVKSALLFGSIPEGPDENQPNGGPIQWEANPRTYYALCSRSRPLIAFRVGSKWLAQTFDFLDGIQGVEQDSASIYEALCHSYFANELASNARSIGYLPNAEGGNQFEIDSPLRLLSLTADTNSNPPQSDPPPRVRPPDMEEVMDAAVGRSIARTPAAPSPKAGGEQ